MNELLLLQSPPGEEMHNLLPATCYLLPASLLPGSLARIIVKSDGLTRSICAQPRHFSY